jgi:hypothetical protein
MLYIQDLKLISYQHFLQFYFALLQTGCLFGEEKKYSVPAFCYCGVTTMVFIHPQCGGGSVAYLHHLGAAGQEV